MSVIALTTDGPNRTVVQKQDDFDLEPPKDRAGTWGTWLKTQGPSTPLRSGRDDRVISRICGTAHTSSPW
jgi:hypothetical protein